MHAVSSAKSPRLSTVSAPHVRLDISSDRPAAALIAAVVIGLTRRCGDTAAARHRTNVIIVIGTLA